MNNEELQYWLEEFKDLEPEEVRELLEALLMDEGKDIPRNTFDGFLNLNKRKHFDIDD